VSRPRKPFGSTRRGRLPSTMIRVLAAEMSDPQRLRRGKQYAADGSVLDITIERGIVTCEVQGSRPTPYIASLSVRDGDGMPLRRDVAAECTCPDDDNFDGHACKHVIATMYAFSDELMVEPELLDLWRGSSPVVDDQRDDDIGRHDNGSADGEPHELEADRAHHDQPRGRRRRHLTLVADRSARSAADDSGDDPADDSDDEPADDSDGDPDGDSLGELLATPAGAALPPLPRFERLEQPMPARPELAAVLRDALSHVRIEWN
jgi:hypothetical protein